MNFTNLFKKLPIILILVFLASFLSCPLISAEEKEEELSSNPGDMNEKGEETDKSVYEEDMLPYSPEQWRRVRDAKEEGRYETKRRIEEKEVKEEIEEEEEREEEEKKEEEALEIEEMKMEGIGVELPYGSGLKITGRKLIDMQYNFVKYSSPEDERTVSGPTEGGSPEINQELQVRIKGNVGENIEVNVDYDDTQENKRDISVVYKSDPEDEVQKSAEFGDITLDLPRTEFVGYRKEVFGAKGSVKYKGLSLTAIGSQTKGINEVKKFRGNSTFQKKDINDNAYKRRRYYKLYFDSAHLPIETGSEEIYIDDKNSDTNDSFTSSMTVVSYDNSISADGYFDFLDRGIDYVVDYQGGIITFRQTIQSNYIIAVSYRDKDGNLIQPSSDRKYMIKAENESLVSRELKNYYDLGNTKIIQGTVDRDFIIKILNLDREEQDFDYSMIEVDYDAGIMRFVDEEPFKNIYGKGDVYSNTNPKHYFLIYTEYEYKVNRITLGRLNIVTSSEKILVDGEVLELEEDYIIDYETGFITFLDPDIIKEDSDVEITYEYMPFGGQFQQTLLGARTELDLGERFFLGSTILYNSPSKPRNIPSVTGAPERMTVLEVDTHFKLEPNRFNPFPTTISAEYAKSIHEPNIYGKAMIEGMEGVKLADRMPTNEESWHISSNPNKPATPDPNVIKWDDDDVNLKDLIEKINPEADTEEIDESDTQQVLEMEYSFTDIDDEASIIYPISNMGADYSEKSHLELWIKGDGEGTDLEIALGSFNEDADGDTKLDTEDINNDGSLNEGEDIGWLFDPWNSRIRGENGRIDSEDLDGDGVLDTGDSPIGIYPSPTYKIVDSLTGTEYDSISWTGWKAIKIDLGINDANKDNWTYIKQIRLTLRADSTDVSGKIEIARLSVVGNKWEKGEVLSGSSGDEFVVGAVNNEDDPYYDDLLDEADYEDIYGEEREQEQALSLKYDLSAGATGYTKIDFPVNQDYSSYERLKFFVYGGKKDIGESPQSKGITFYMRIGSSSNYWQFSRRVDWKDWRELEVELEDRDGNFVAEDVSSDDLVITHKGSPQLTNVSMIELGVYNDTGSDVDGGEIWVNEIYLDGVRKKEGHAKMLKIDSELPGWASFGGKYKYKDRNFETIGTPSTNQDVTSFNTYAKLSRLSYLPVSGEYSQTETITPEAAITPTQESSYISSRSEGRELRYAGSIKADFFLAPYPKIGSNLAKDVTYSDDQQEHNIKDTYKGSFGYTVPLDIFALPKKVDFAYTRTNQFNYFYTPDEEMSVNPWKKYFYESSNDFSGSLNFQMSKLLNLTPSYKLNKVRLRKNISDENERITWPKSGSQEVKFNADLKLSLWLNPKVSYAVTNSQTYSVPSDTTTFASGPQVKKVNRSSQGSINWNFPFRSLIQFSPTDSLSFDTNYSLNVGDIYEGVRHSYRIFDKLWLYKNSLSNVDEDKRKSYSSLATLKLNSSWKPLDFLDLKGGLYPFKTLNSKVSLTKIGDHKNITGTIQDTRTRVWPDVRINLSSLEKFPGLGFTSSNKIIGDYSKKIVDKENISLTRTDDWQGDWLFTLFKKFELTLGYDNKKEKEIDTRTEELRRLSISKAYNNQLKFNLFPKWTMILNYDDTISKAETGGKLTTDKEQEAYKLRLYSDRIELPWNFRIPFTKKFVKFRNKMKFDFSMGYACNKSSLDVDRNNFNTYSASLSAEYDVSSNIRFTLGSGFQLFDYKAEQNNYYSANINTKLTITF